MEFGEDGGRVVCAVDREDGLLGKVDGVLAVGVFVHADVDVHESAAVACGCPMFGFESDFGDKHGVIARDVRAGVFFGAGSRGRKEAHGTDRECVGRVHVFFTFGSVPWFWFF